MGRLEGKVAVVTGAASGIGLATARRFVAEGARVALADINREAGEAAQTELGDATLFVATDVSAEDDIERLFEQTRKQLGALDIVFNNAGLGGALGPLHELDAEHWDYTFDVLVRSVFLGMKYATRALREAGRGGAIVNTASVAGMAGGGGPHAYSASKAAVVSMTQNAAVELAPQRIRVNAICPGVIFTPLMHRGREEAAEEKLEGLQPWPDRGEPEDIAAAVLFLASDEARFVTGQTLVADGGLMAAGTRIFHNLPGGTRVNTVAGVTHGTTGNPPEVRRLDDG